MKARYIFFRFYDITKPIIELKDRADQVVVRFIPYGTEHVTIHIVNGKLFKNFTLPDVAHPEWLEEVSRIAQQRYRDWYKHLKYAYANQPLVKLENQKGYHLIGRLIDLEGFIPKDKYWKRCDNEIQAPASKFMLHVYLSTPENRCEEFMAKVPTVLGDLCFAFEVTNHD